ncbi:MAG: esterase family protein [Dysgonamonadaceae bacterium]|jgi:S-formylglutathione hydrolase FrmB|nr:esterase family protein [Dysgonamonadaceae bacterium]
MKQRIIFIISLALILISTYARAAKVDSIAIPSRSMNLQVKAVVILPDAALKTKPERCPVVYLLNGYSGNEQQWLGIKPELPKIADEKTIIFVCPDGKNSWYLNSPLKKESQYETFISSEMPAYIDANYATVADRNHRAITGLSMGGHGALYNAFRHPEIFGAVGSTSGAVDVRNRGNNYELVDLLGDMASHRENWEESSVMNMLDRISNGQLAICFDCGASDFCFPLNEALDKALWAKGIDHDYTIRQGNHNKEYWKNSIDYHILFFNKYFHNHE